MRLCAASDDPHHLDRSQLGVLQLEDYAGQKVQKVECGNSSGCSDPLRVSTGQSMSENENEGKGKVHSRFRLGLSANLQSKVVSVSDNW